MTHFRSIYKSLAISGFHPRLLHQKYPFNAKITKKTLMVYLCYWLDFILFCMFLSQNAHNVAEYLDGIFWISIIFLNTAFYTVFMCKIGKLFRFLDMCEKIIDKRKQINVNKSDFVNFTSKLKFFFRIKKFSVRNFL